MYEWEKFTNQKQWEKYLKSKLKTNNKFLFRGLLVVYNNQTMAEKYAGKSIDWNNKGFSRVDCVEMSRIAKTMIDTKKITEDDFWYIYSRMPKYWKQLMQEAKKKMKNKKESEKDFESSYKFVGDQLIFRWCLNA